MSQLPLEFTQQPSFDLSDFIVTASNDEAYRFVTQPDLWPSHFCALVGPRSSGKTHLLRGWATQIGAHAFQPTDKPQDVLPAAFYFIDDIEAKDDAGAYLIDDQTLFHLFNWSREMGTRVLVSAEHEPNRWQRRLPDLQSRLGLMAVARLGAPDDVLLTSVLIKLFSDRQLTVSMKLIEQMLKKMERSLSAAEHMVQALDKAALAQKRDINQKLVTDYFKAQSD